MWFDYVISSSYGNDSVALIQYMYDQYHDKDVKIAVVYSDTGWHEEDWIDRVRKGERWVRSLGFTPLRTTYTNECGSGMEALVRKYQKFSPTANKWCTKHLKMVPFNELLEKYDPEKDTIIVTGVRREESKARSTHAEHVAGSKNHNGRDLWCPLVRHKKKERDALIAKTPFKTPLPHGSMECNPCVFSGRHDACHITEHRVKVIFEMEEDLKEQIGEEAFFFNPKRRMGAKGIHEAMRWAECKRGQFVPKDGFGGEQMELFLKAHEQDNNDSGCTSGMCNT